MRCPPWRRYAPPSQPPISPGWWRPLTRRCCPATRRSTKIWVAPRLRPAEFLSGSNPAALRRLVEQLRTRPFDLVVDVQGLIKSAVWVALAKSPRKVGYDKTRELSYLALTERVPPFDSEAHAVWRYLNLAHYLGAPPTLPRFRLGLTRRRTFRR